MCLFPEMTFSDKCGDFFEKFLKTSSKSDFKMKNATQQQASHFREDI